ncbi:MAG: acetoacetate metabolism regulatory protein AtoC [Candidatus Tectimicrobiota bacterium]|nr:MAG: acetoacetate metabolism regulatory protein AtoC [Candidatus Tectomicrobia bacterium]
MAGERILIVDDEPANLDFLREALTTQGYVVDTTTDPTVALERLEQDVYHVLLTDLKMPRMSGVELIRRLKEKTSFTMGIVFTAYASIETAVEAIKAGAYDYVRKPFKLEELYVVLQRALEYQRLHAENVNLRRQLKAKYRYENIVSDHPKMQEVFATIEKVADSDSTVLICGESGTGKELIARAIHYNSYRQDKPLVPINCAAIPAELLEAELFGYEKGAFTGATATRIGRFELAHGGTLFLDEIAEMSPALQAKLLRVLQEREFERVGGVRTIKVDVRIIAATNKNIEELVARNQFREDLYYRLNVIPIHVPPLRERKSDIPLLVTHFIERFNAEKRRQIQGITPEALQVLMNYDWPGNVRELENAIERAVILKGSGLITPADLPPKLAQGVSGDFFPVIDIPDEGLDFEGVMQAFERQLLTKALQKTHGVKSKAAELLHMNRTTLVEKVKKLRLDV